MCRLIQFGVALICVSAVVGNVSAQVTLLWEDFDGLTLTDSVDEGVAGPVGDGGGTPAADVWTDVPPAGWTDNDAGVPGIAEPPDNNGVFDWAGWNFADRDWWVTTAGDQRRSEFVNASGTVMIADADEWDDADHPGGPPDGPWFNTFMSTSAISLAGIDENTVTLDFDSSWRDEFDDNYHQTANIEVTYEGINFFAQNVVLLWESDTASPNHHDDAPNEHVTLDLHNPAGATEMTIIFGLFDAGNDWWWAIDNVHVEGVPEPSALAMGVWAALLGLGALRRRTR